MFASITLENFFSFAGPVHIPLNSGANVLIGINGSGKSNFIRAIQLLHEAIAGKGLENLFQTKWGGFTNVAFFGRDKKDVIRLSFEFDRDQLDRMMGGKGYRFRENPVYELSIHRQGERDYYLEEGIYSDQGEATPFVYLNMRKGQGVISTRSATAAKPGLVRYPDPEGLLQLSQSEPVLRQVSDPQAYFPLHTLRTAIGAIASYGYFDTAFTSKLREAADYDTRERLAADASNLVSLLIRLKNNHTFDYDALEEAFRTISPHFKSLGFDPLGTKMLLTLMERNLSRTISVEHISDGSLRFLILLSILLNPNRGSLILLDEPETGLHPDMIHTVGSLIKSAGQTSQLIAATHSPLLLNSFEVDDVLVFEKDEHNQSRAEFKSEDSFPAWQEGFTTGQLWLQGKIGGNRW